MGRLDEATAPSFHWLFTGWRGFAVAVFAACALFVCIVENIEDARQMDIFGRTANGTLGFSADAVVGRPGWERITRINPGGAAARAGLSAGMLLRYDHPYQAAAAFVGGQPIGVTAATADAPVAKQRHLILVATPDNFDAQPLQVRIGTIVYALSTIIALALGMLALFRGWGRITALALGLGMLAYGSDSLVPAWAAEPGPAIGMIVAHALTVLGGLGLILLPAALYAERVRAPSRAWMALFVLTGLVWAAGDGYIVWCTVHDASYPVIGNGRVMMFGALFVLNLQGLYWCRRGWRDAAAADRSRFLTILFATVFQLFNGVAIVLTPFIAIDLGQTATLAIQISSSILTNLLIPLSLAYAVLRHRVVELGFVFNRTLVYGTVSAILLGSFGLIEWGVEHLLPEEWVKASAWIDAGAAVMVYLAFHRVHDAVERRVEHLFFHQWQANEEALRRFVGSAPHFEDARALARGFADELARFGGDARVAVYRRNEGVLDRVAGNWDNTPRHFRDDDPAFALMRAERAPLDLDAMRTDLPGVLALPMLDHGALAGLVLLDLKGNGALYRPDEVALLGWAAHEVGLALAALHAGLIETENRLLKAQLGRLSNIIGERLDRSPA